MNVRRLVWTFGAALALSASPATAVKITNSAVPAGVPGSESVAASPQTMIRSSTDQLEEFIRAGGAGDEVAVITFLTQVVAPMFDFQGMSRWASGPVHRRLDESQRERLAGRVQAMFLGALARNLGTYTNPMPRIQLAPVRALYRGQAHVRAHILRPQRRPILLDFRFYQVGGEWKIFDVAANGNSAATYYRALIRREWRRDSLQGLLQ